jgi:short-subunit dehydrogenase
MSNTALITGASSGIGKALSHYHAAKKGNLVLVARRGNALQKLKAELEARYGIQATVIVADLSQHNAAQTIFKTTEEARIQIDILINNAGFGGHGNFHESDLDKMQNMMQVNMSALVSLTHLYVQGMIERKKGRILHVASTAGFLPGPLQAVYYATKSFVVSFSQAISQELKGSHVTSTALCPGPVHTDFVRVGDLEGVPIWDRAATAESVARIGYRAMEKGKLIAINDTALNFLIHWIQPFMPRKMILRISQMMMEKKRQRK